MNIPSTTSPEAKYIVDVEKDYKTERDGKNNTTNRILEMKKRLEKIKRGN
jgi:hypothetical protein